MAYFLCFFSLVHMIISSHFTYGKPCISPVLGVQIQPCTDTARKHTAYRRKGKLYSVSFPFTISEARHTGQRAQAGRHGRRDRVRTAWYVHTPIGIPKLGEGGGVPLDKTSHNTQPNFFWRVKKPILNEH